MKKEKAKQKEIEIPLTIEQKYGNLVGLMDSMNCMRNTWEKVDMYSNISAKFAELGDHEDSKVYIEECNKLMKHTEEEIKKNHYKKAENLKKMAKTAKDYRIAAEEYSEANGYLDADSHAKECESLSNKIENNRIKNALIKRGLFIAAIAAAIIISFVPIVRYTAANTLMSVRSYSVAIKVYNRLGDYKDSKENILKSNYRMGIKLEKEGNYNDAHKAYVNAQGYKDSDIKEVNLVKQIITQSEVGNTVKFGPFNWIILNKAETSALLIKKTGLQGLMYHTTFEDITWEKSSIRNYLNTEFLSNTFTEEEQRNIVETNVVNNKSTIYGTDGGSDTLDHVFLLSTEEALQYEEIIDVFKNSSWLRSPGNSQNSAAFLKEKGIVMDYGYMVSSDVFTTHPVIWFNMK